MTAIRPHHWLAALVMALGAHAALAGLMPDEDPPGAEATGTGDIAISLTMVAARAGGEIDSAAREAEKLPEVMELQESEENSADYPEIAPEISPQEQIPALDVPVIEPQPEPVEPVEPEIVEAAEPVPEEVVPDTAQARPVSRPEPPEVQAQPEPVQHTEVAARHDPERDARVSDRRVSASAAMQRGGGQVEDGAEADSEDAQDARGGGVTGVVTDRYAGRLRAWLERHKTYPDEARRRRMEGVVYLYFRASRDGRVVAHEIRKSSGFALLDRETEELLQRAQPLPSFTSGMTANYVDIVVPIDYSMRRRR